MPIHEGEMYRAWEPPRDADPEEDDAWKVVKTVIQDAHTTSDALGETLATLEGEAEYDGTGITDERRDAARRAREEFCEELRERTERRLEFLQKHEERALEELPDYEGPPPDGASAIFQYVREASDPQERKKRIEEMLETEEGRRALLSDVPPQVVGFRDEDQRAHYREKILMSEAPDAYRRASTLRRAREGLEKSVDRFEKWAARVEEKWQRRAGREQQW